MKKELKFDIYHPGELDAGIYGYTDCVTITIESGNPGGNPGEFKKYMQKCLAKWYDGADVTINKEQS